MSKEETKEQFSFEKIGILEEHDRAVTSLICGIDEKGDSLLISGSRDKSIIRWKLHVEEQKEIITKLDDLEVDEGQPKEIKKYIVGEPLKSFRGHIFFSIKFR